MRSQISRILSQQQKNMKFLSARCMTTSTDPRKASGLSLNAKGDFIEKGEVQKSSYPSIEIPNTDVFTNSFLHLENWGHKTYTECALTGRKYTFDETYYGALRWGAAIKNLLPNSTNPTIAFICPNSPDFVTMFIGTLAAAAVVSPINPLYTPEEIANQLRDSNAELVVIEDALEPLADAAFKCLGKNLPVVVNGQSKFGRPNARELLNDPNAKQLDYKPVDPESIAILPCSSGTTGKPKCVEISHRALVNNVSQVNNRDAVLTPFAYGAYQENFLGLLPFFHIFGITAILLPAVQSGNKIITMPKFDPVLFVETLKKNPIHCFPIVPSLLQFIGNFNGITAEDLKSTHSFVCGSAPLSNDIAMKIKDKAPHAFLQEGYGMTETLVSLLTPPNNERIGSCGKLLAGNEGKIIDIETGNLLPPNTSGELLIKTQSVMKGYRNNQEATDNTLDKDGWIHTGDVAMFDEEGFVTIVDRIKELIKVKGLQVSPTELEETLQKHPGVYEAGVVGVPHELNGEAPVAYIVASEKDVSESDIQAFMSEHLAQHKQLVGGIKFVDELPKNAIGKILRKVLKKMAVES